MGPDALVGGRVEPGYEPVAEAFARNLDDGDELGAAFAACVDGRLVVDLWGGIADASTGRVWAGDTLQPIFSGTKGLVALCLAMLAERGRIDLDAPVAALWPEFAAAGKGDVLVRHAVSHTAGVPGIRAREVSFDEVRDDRVMAALLAEEEPLWPAGETLSYHPLAYGWLCAELVRRADGRSVGRFFAEEVAAPLGLEVWIGLPAREEARVARLELADAFGATPATDPDQIAADPRRRAAWGNPPLLTRGGLDWNDRATHAAEMAGASGIGHVRSLARLYGCLACGGELDGVRLLSPAALERAVTPLSEGVDPLTDEPSRFAAGFALQHAEMRFGPVEDGFGHGGAGGSAHGAWPSRGAGFSYAMNLMRDDEDDDRAASLLDALAGVVAPV